jgi:diguanylate cyclase (GGDEF)-like protein
MILDLDRLKPINDEFGHEAGDQVLTKVAAILRKLCRAADHVSRWGGDEFVVVCRDADLAAASSLAERVRHAVASQIFQVGDGRVARTSCSIGFATYPFVVDVPDKLSWEQTLALSDAALYQAKRQRNAWVGWSGTAAAAGIDDLLQSAQAEPESLEADGLVEVRRSSQPSQDDTMGRLVALGSRTRD